MVLKNTLFKKGYLLTGVIIAANMFVVDEMKATDEENRLRDTYEKGKKLNEEERKKIEENNKQKNFFTQQGTKDTTIEILFRENYFNFFCTLALSGFNNYFKWWDYNPGTYCKFVWFGWRSKKLLNDIFQFEVNLNVIMGILWLLPGYLFFFVQKGFSRHKKETACSFTISLQFFPVRCEDTDEVQKKNHFRSKVITFPLFILQGFISAPLTFHISNFSIAISLDSIFWELVAMVAIWARKRIDNGKEYRRGGEKIE